MKTKTISFVGDDEKIIVEEFCEYMGRFNDVILGGHNITGFDMPLMLSRMIKYQVPEVKLFGTRYDCIDTFEKLAFAKKDGKLQDYLDLFGMEGKYNGLDGSKVQELYENNDWYTIKKYVEQDSKVEHELIMRTLPYFKKTYDLNSIFTFDIETVCDTENRMSFNSAYSEYEEQIRSDVRIKKEDTILKKLLEFNYESFVADKIKKDIFSRFKNKIVAVSITHNVEEVEF